MDEVTIVPTVGRMVYYKSLGSKCGKYPPKDRASIITDVRETTADIKSPHQVRLCVLNPEGMFFTDWLWQGQECGQWDWMPYQKGQAKKTEELEKKLA